MVILLFLFRFVLKVLNPPVVRLLLLVEKEELVFEDVRASHLDAILLVHFALDAEKVVLVFV